MQQLKHLMQTRSQFMSSFKHRKSHPLDNKLAQQLMHQLLTQKKKLHLNQSQQSKLSQTVITHKLQSPYKLMKIVMKGFVEEFLTDSDKEEINQMIVGKDERKRAKATNFKRYAENGQQVGINPLSHHQNDPQSQQLSPAQTIQQFKPEKQLSSNIQDKRKLTFKIVKLYHDFFLIQKSSTKAEEIMHVYKKKLCDQAIIVPTIFCWLNDWVAKEFASFVRKEISELGKARNSVIKEKIKQQNGQKQCQKQLAQVHETTGKMKKSAIFQPPSPSPKKKHKRKANQVQPDMFFSIDLDHGKSKQDLYQKIDKISMINKSQKDDSQEGTKGLERTRSRKRMSLQRAEMFFTIQGNNDDKNPSKNIPKDTKKLSINPYQISNLLPFKSQTYQQAKKQPFPNEQPQSSPINRQILIGAFYQKYINLYKSLQAVLPDLDINYIKQIKRNDRKGEIKKRVKEICRAITRNQPLIRSSIEEYQAVYFERKRRQQKQLKNKKHRYYHHAKNLENQQVNDTEIQPTTRYSSLYYSLTINEHNQIASEKKINSNRSLRKQPNDETNLDRIYQKRRQDRQKQVFSLNHPIKFEFNLPSLPQKQRNIQTRLKEPSKIVLIQSGRYKLLDTIETKELAEMSNRKKKLSSYSIELSDHSEKPQSVVRNESYSSKKIAQLDRRSASIFQIITKKKRPIPEEILQISIKQTTHEAPINQPVLSRRKYRNTKSIRDNQRVQKQFKKVLQNLEGNDYGLISGWQKGQESPQMS